VKTDLASEELASNLWYFDNISVKYLNDSWIWKIYEILLPFNWKFSEIIWSKINSWDIPQSILPWVEIIQPEAIKLIGDTTYLYWESLTNMWWQTSIWSQNYQEWLSTKAKIKIWVIDTWIDYNNSDLSWNVYKNTSEILNINLDLS
jgi:hypothetical protein